MPVRRLLIVVLTVALAALGLTSTASAGAVGSIAGKATDTGGTPLAGVAVTAYSYDTSTDGSATTGVDGTFTIGNLPPGNYFVCFDPVSATGGSSPTGYRKTCWHDVDNTEGASYDDLTLIAVTDGGSASGIVQALPSTGGVSGTITDANGTPLTGAVVSAANGPGSPAQVRGQATTDASGHYVINRLRPGTDYTVCVSAKDVTGGLSSAGYLDQCYGGVRAQWGRTPWPSDYPTFSVSAAVSTALDQIRLEAASRIEGTLTNKDGQPVAGVNVQGDTVGDETVSTTAVTDSNGHYVLTFGDDGAGSNALYFDTRLPSLAYRIYFNTFPVPAYVSQDYKGVLTAGNSTSWGGTATLVTPAPGVITTADDQLTLGASIAGTVTDGHGTSLAGVGVSIYHNDDYMTDTMSDDSGHYSFIRLPPGDYKLCFNALYTSGGVSAAGYMDSCWEPVTVTTGQQRTNADRALQPASGISGYLYGPSFEPLPYRSVYLYQDGVPGYGYASTNSEGKYLFPRLPAGTYKVCFQVYSPVAWEGCYNGAADVASATPITTTLGSVVTDINGQATATPDTTAPTALMTKPSTLVQTSRTITLGVATDDAESGVASYDLRYRYADWNDSAFSPYQSPSSWQNRTGAAPNVTGTPGRTYCYSVRARDNVGNVSGYSPEKCVTVPLDDRALGVTAGTWRRTTSPNTVEGTISRTTTYGATLSLPGGYADRVGLVVTTCPGCGQVGIYVNGSLIATLSTWSSTVRKKVLLLPRTFSYRSAKIVLRLKQHDRALVVDALAVTRR